MLPINVVDRELEGAEFHVVFELEERVDAIDVTVTIHISSTAIVIIVTAMLVIIKSLTSGGTQRDPDPRNELVT